VDTELRAATLVDLAFPLLGRALPRDHRAPLAAALAERLPWLGEAPGSGVLRVNVVAGAGPVALLSARARLVLRVPRERADEAQAALAGGSLQVDGQTLTLGMPVRRELLPHRTLYAHFVAAPDDDELGFLAMVDAELRALGVACRPVCGRRQALQAGDAALPGFSLMLDGLTPADALRVLEAGVGAHRGLGCGLFVPHRSAAAVGA
jgi:CRISPR-associated protein Cas6